MFFLKKSSSIVFTWVSIYQNKCFPLEISVLWEARTCLSLTCSQNVETKMFLSIFFFFCLICLFERRIFVFVFLPSPFHIYWLPVSLPSVCLPPYAAIYLSIHLSVYLPASTRTMPLWPSWFRTNWTPTRLMTPLWGRWAELNFLSLFFLLNDLFGFHCCFIFCCKIFILVI